jgi:hypothetical protein
MNKDSLVVGIKEMYRNHPLCKRQQLEILKNFDVEISTNTQGAGLL